MSIDAEITRINEGIMKIHLALYKFNNHLSGILIGINEKLSDFDKKVDNAVERVNRVKKLVDDIFEHFPNDVIYYSVILMMVFILDLFCLYLIYYIYKWIVEREVHFDKEIRWYKRKVYSLIDNERWDQYLYMTESWKGVLSDPYYIEHSRISE
ncbi:hypothetical protein DICVIV_08731 [Dictyocaulus viviparus]|uniref:Uncharacterized protein n=1 Tax=Dictyocaulus viviparus TaxID=29172 RepID=A0A0D8XN75_DICVI|nr:hypothetical protein DICVIV_08731 [Dictyocaulus viviparus]